MTWEAARLLYAIVFGSIGTGAEELDVRGI